MYHPTTQTKKAPTLWQLEKIYRVVKSSIQTVWVELSSLVFQVETSLGASYPILDVIHQLDLKLTRFVQRVCLMPNSESSPTLNFPWGRVPVSSLGTMNREGAYLAWVNRQPHRKRLWLLGQMVSPTRNRVLSSLGSLLPRSRSYKQDRRRRLQQEAGQIYE